MDKIISKDNIEELRQLIEDLIIKEINLSKAEEELDEAKSKLERRISELTPHFNGNYFYYKGRVYKLISGKLQIMENVINLEG